MKTRLLKIWRACRLVLLATCMLFGYTNCNKLTKGLNENPAQIGPVYPHSATFRAGPEHSSQYYEYPEACKSCHGSDYSGGTSKVSCLACHVTHNSQPKTCTGCHISDKPADSHQFATQDCSQCHSYSTGSFSQLPTQNSKFQQSPHALSTGAFSGHASASCGRCHNEKANKDYLGVDGSAEFIVNGTAFTAPGPLDCSSCHNSKTSAFKDVGVVLYSPSGEALTVGREGFCVSCHMGRTGEGKLRIDAAILGQAANTKLTGNYTYAQWPGNTATGGTVSGSTNRAAAIAPHYFPAAAVYYGHDAKVGYEYPSQTYAAKNPHVSQLNTCVGCHDAHTAEVKVQACVTCHSPVTSAGDLKNIRLHSTPDYDGDGDTSEGVAAEVEGMKAKLLQAIQNYAAGARIGVPIFYNGERGQQKFVTASGGTTSYPAANYTPLLLKATFNYVLADRDGGSYAHNSRYILQLLYDSIRDLNDNGLDDGVNGNRVDISQMYRPNP